MFNFPFSQQGFLIPVNPGLVAIPIPPPEGCLYALPTGDTYGIPGGGSYALPSCPPPPIEDNDMIQATDNVAYTTINSAAVTIISAQTGNYSLRDLILTVNTPVTAATAGNLLIGSSGGAANSVATIPLSALSSAGVIRLGAGGTAVVPQTYFNGTILAANTLQISSDVTLTAGNISISSNFIIL